MSSKKNIPAIRFKGFCEDWETKLLGDIGCVSMNKRVFKHQTSNNGDIPFYKIGTFGGVADAYITKELFEEYRQKYPYPQNGDILISASGSIGRTVEYLGEDAYFQDSNIVWLNHNNKVRNIFLKCFYEIVKWYGIEGSTIKRLYNSNILNTSIILPQNNEQQQIGNYFKNIDHLITQSTKRLEKLKNLKKAYLEKMFPRGGATTPELRFKGFSEEWEETELSEIFDIKNGYTPSKAINSYWENGTIPWFRMEDIRLNGRILKDALQHVTPQAIKSSGLYPAGSFILSTTATIGEHALLIADSLANQRFSFLIKKLNRWECIDEMFIFYQMFALGDWCRANTNAGGLAAVSMIDLAKYKFALPQTKDEQQKIGNFFRNIDEQIAKQTEKLDKLKNIKKACLDKMFV